MRDKSKFIGFILSFIPGLAQIYIGLKERGFIFLGMLAALFIGSLLFGMITYFEFFIAIFFIGYGILWLIALLDLFSTWKFVANKKIKESLEEVDEESIKINNKKTMTLALSIIPGAGHMYLGYQNKGLLIMGAFFFSVFFMGWLGISLLLFLLPLIWFYGFFDAMHIVDGSKDRIKEEDIKLPKLNNKWIGYGLIGIGLIIILERILYPLIDYHIRRYIQTSIVSLIFIVLGLLILKNSKDQEKREDENEN